MESMKGSKIIRDYQWSRIRNPVILFSDTLTDRILSEFGKAPFYYKNHSLLNNGVFPDQEFENKGISDSMAIALWNDIVGDSYRIKHISSLKSAASRLVDDFDRVYPKGDGMNEADAIRYITAHSCSSFIGIQRPNRSRFAMNSMHKSLNAHSINHSIYKPWLLSNLEFVSHHIHENPHIMDRDYADLCMNAKMSSSSLKGAGKFRDFVMESTLDEIISELWDVPYLIYVGTRSDRRGKFRLICSMDGRLRVIDFLLNNGSYEICEGDGLLSKYTTEGFNSSQLWAEYVKMSQRSGLSMICIDYSGFDSQISLHEYAQLSSFLNSYRKDDRFWGPILKWYNTWLSQPKPLVSRSSSPEILIPCYTTLASGLHGTHSFENMIGISMFYQAQKEGIEAVDFWTNGDDQNILIRDSSVSDFMDFISRYFIISPEKSLIGHSLSVWGKQWFSESIDPVPEIGTFRSIWEREGGEVNYVEESKFLINYSKIVQVAMLLLRMGKSDVHVARWIRVLCDCCSPKINPYQIPHSLENLTQIKSSSHKRRGTPNGLLSSKSELLQRDFDLKIFGASNYYDLLVNMYSNRTFFSLEVSDPRYHPRGTELCIEANYDYSFNMKKKIPFVFHRLYRPTHMGEERSFVRSILQSTKSYDGPFSRDYVFHDMLSLAKCLVRRNKDVWRHLST